MGLPASQQRVLDRIEDALKKREPRLASMFAMFARLTRHEGPPRFEALIPVPWWSLNRYTVSARIRAGVFLTLAAALVISAVFLGMSQSRDGCRAPVVIRGPLTESTHTQNCPAAAVAKSHLHGP